MPAAEGDAADPDVLIDFAKVSLRRGGQTLVGPITWAVELDERWVVIGPNGAGKTSLLRIAAALEHPSSGTRCDNAELLRPTRARSSAMSVRPSRSPSTYAVPDDGCSSAAAIRSSDVFPAPLGPNTWPSADTARCPKASASAC
ncbi:hypothetical protein A5698_00995 [Mycobacterium sp. E136]|nr:hypothetical protein A5698_00995 [Mycobacterium sp. E136]